MKIILSLLFWRLIIYPVNETWLDGVTYNKELGWEDPRAI